MKLGRTGIAIVPSVCLNAAPVPVAADERQLVADGAEMLSGRVHGQASGPRSYLGGDKSQITLEFVLDWRIAHDDQLRRATGGSIERASQRFTEIIDDRLRNKIATVTAGRLPASLTAFTTAVIAASREPAAQLGVDLVDLRFSE